MDIQERMQDEQPTTVNSETCDEAINLARNACGHGHWDEMLREDDAKKRAALMSRLYSSAVQGACLNTSPSLDPKDSTKKAVRDQCLKIAKLVGAWVAETECRASTQAVKPAKGKDADGAKPAQAAAKIAK
jgi:hypothetical protein